MCQCCLLWVQVNSPGGATGTTAVREQLAAVKKEFCWKTSYELSAYFEDV